MGLLATSVAGRICQGGCARTGSAANIKDLETGTVGEVQDDRAKGDFELDAVCVEAVVFHFRVRVVPFLGGRV